MEALLDSVHNHSVILSARQALRFHGGDDRIIKDRIIAEQLGWRWHDQRNFKPAAHGNQLKAEARIPKLETNPNVSNSKPIALDLLMARNTIWYTPQSQPTCGSSVHFPATWRSIPNTSFQISPDDAVEHHSPTSILFVLSDLR